MIQKYQRILDMINNNETGTALLRIVEVIGQDELENR